MNVIEKIPCKPFGSKVFDGRVSILISWKASPTPEEAVIKLVNLDIGINKVQQELEFNQKVNQLKTSTGFKNLEGDICVINVWMELSDKNQIELFLNYPIDSHDEFQSIIAVWE